MQGYCSLTKTIKTFCSFKLNKILVYFINFKIKWKLNKNLISKAHNKIIKYWTKINRKNKNINKLIQNNKKIENKNLFCVFKNISMHAKKKFSFLPLYLPSLHKINYQDRLQYAFALTPYLSDSYWLDSWHISDESHFWDFC